MSASSIGRCFLPYHVPVQSSAKRLVAFVAALAVFLSQPFLRAVSGAQASQPPTIFIDASATDDTGGAVASLRPNDLRVSVDGEQRKVVSLRYVYRGPGADTAAALADPSRDAPAAAERVRSVLLLPDEDGIFRGQHKALAAVVTRMLEELGAADQVAVAPLPRLPAQLSFGDTPAERQAVVVGIAGRATPGGPLTAPVFPEPVPNASDTSTGAEGADPGEQSRLEQERQSARDRRAALDEPVLGLPDTTTGASVRALQSVVDGLARVPGLKSVVVFRQMEWANQFPATDASRNAVSAVLASAARARAVVHLVLVGQAGRRRTAPDDEMGAIAAGTGGTITIAKNVSDSKAFDALRAVLFGGYLVEVEARERDGAARPHTVKIESALAKTTVRGPSLWVARADPVPALVVAARSRAAEATSTAASQSAAPVPPGGAEARSTKRRSSADDPRLALLLARLSEYTTGYVRDFGNVVAEEDYVQRLTRGGSDQRNMKSDLLLVKTNAEVGWTQYRDVFEVDGRPVRDREARVQKLFLENPADAPRLAQEISQEGARYNVGSVSRNINTPTLPLEYLSPKTVGGLTFWLDGEDTIEGTKALKLAFEETSRPTLVQRTTAGGADVPAAGIYWVDPTSGRVLKTRISLTAGRADMSTTVSYKPASNLGLWVPWEMNERYSTPAQEIEGRASYRNFRSFKVTTEATVKQ